MERQSTRNRRLAVTHSPAKSSHYSSKSPEIMRQRCPPEVVTRRLNAVIGAVVLSPPFDGSSNGDNLRGLDFRAASGKTLKVYKRVVLPGGQRAF